ncbi:hypothetical protein EYF80_022428 [Liparis tanakae]|uniref:Uncharacterized protein n=1 Tax=Liparis tanakae TaxID=230148 RepID=A0A4Z2HP25_9TELE|nr:hypothetical protein EYF80_022428 [Liparis tanakae]
MSFLGQWLQFEYKTRVGIYMEYAAQFLAYVQNAELTCTTHAVVSEEQLTTSVELVSDPGGVVTRV